MLTDPRFTSAAVLNDLQFCRDLAYALRIREPHWHYKSARVLQSSRESGARIAANFAIGTTSMPSLIRLLTVIAILCGVVYGGLYSLAHFVQPSPREMSVSISPSKFYKEHRRR
jgi:hypothetical protein